MTKGTFAVALVALLLGLGIGIVGFSGLGPQSNPVISGVGNVHETVMTDVDARRIAELAAGLVSFEPVTDEMLSASLTAIAAKAADGDVQAMSILMEIARLQRDQE